MKGQIVFLTGVPGVGKTTVGQLLAERRAKAVFVDLDSVRSFVVSGLRQPSQGWDEEVEHQFLLAHKAAAAMATLYAEGGFDVFIAHCSGASHLLAFREGAPDAVLIYLSCEIRENVERNNNRMNKSFDPRDIEFFVHQLAPSMRREVAPRCHWSLDTTGQSEEQTVDAVDAFLASVAKPN